MDLENQETHYNIPVNALYSLFDPKSIRALIEVGGWERLKLALNIASVNEGLSWEALDAEERQAHYGANVLPQKVPVTFWELCYQALSDATIILLSIFALISLALGLYETFFLPPDVDEHGRPLPKVDWVEGCAILLAVIIIVLVTAINDYNKEKQFMKLNAKKEDRNVIVFRDGEKSYIPIGDLLVGDIVCVETGDILPADCIMVYGECECDESSVTGESKSIVKHPINVAMNYFDANVSSEVGDKGALDPFLISGSKVIAGQGRVVVICVGVNSLWGKTMMSLDVEEQPTPLQEKLENLTNSISKYAFLVAILLLIILFLEFAMDWMTGRFHHTPGAKMLGKVMDIFITAITIVVVALPEGLPLAVTLALAFATTRMANDGNLVRVLKSCETMGSATTICSDKTGTLTINKMSVVEYLIGDKISTNVNIHDENNYLDNAHWEKVLLENVLLNSTAFQNNYYEEKSENSVNDFDVPRVSVKDWIKSKLGFGQPYQPLLPISVARNSSESMERTLVPSSTTLEGHPKPHDSSDPFVGSKTECALLSFVYKKYHLSDNATKDLQQYRDEHEDRLAQVIPFESSLKWSGIALDNLDGTYTVYIKGASEIVFQFCKYYRLPNCETKNLDEESKAKIFEVGQSVAGKALRTVSLASYTFKADEWEKLDVEKFAKFPFTLDLIVGLQDPLRPGVKDAIDQCHRAGVNVKMVTGDNILTARAISLNCGILDETTFNDDAYYIEGPQFRALSDNERKNIVKKLRVMARSSPEDKRILVKTLKSLGEVVAVTGDGTNDAPALKLADVGFSMGISGTEVAREASDIVLMSDDFSSIVDAIKWGRTIGNSIKKFVQFQLTVNVTAVVLTFWTSVDSKDNVSVLTAVQLLWVNLIMDTLAALALATDKPDDDVLDSKPTGRGESMIDFSMWKMILGTSFAQLFITLHLYYYGGEIFYGKRNHQLTIFERKSIAAMNFNTFVWMQVFTLFVSRKLNECQNVRTICGRFNRANIGFFQGLSRNEYFLIIVVLISVGQCLIMKFGGYAFSVTPQTPQMWIYSLLFGFSMIPIGAFLRLIPDNWIEDYLPMGFLLRFLGVVEWVLLGFGLWDWVYDKIFSEGEDPTSSIEEDAQNEIVEDHASRTSEEFVETSSANTLNRETHKMKHLNVN